MSRNRKSDAYLSSGVQRLFSSNEDLISSTTSSTTPVAQDLTTKKVTAYDGFEQGVLNAVLAHSTKKQSFLPKFFG